MNLLHKPVGLDRILALMKVHRNWLQIITLGCGWIMAVTKLLAGAEIEFVDKDRVVFLGGTIFDRDRLYGEVETALTSHFKGRSLTFRNLGWDGDTVFGHARVGGRRGAVFGDVGEGYQAIIDQVAKVDPTVVFVAYGAVEAHGGLGSLAAFEKGLGRLLSDLSAPHRRFILLTPLRILGEDVTQRVNAAAQVDRMNILLQTYRDAIVRIGESRQMKVVDLFSATSLLQRDHRVNGLHLSELGYEALGRYFVEVECVAAETTGVLDRSLMGDLRSLVRRKSELYYNWWRPRNDAFVFGERKSEQVPVQLELPQFESLIANLEASIAALVR